MQLFEKPADLTSKIDIWRHLSWVAHRENFPGSDPYHISSVEFGNYESDEHSHANRSVLASPLAHALALIIAPFDHKRFSI